jgi:hypothetical protein
MRELFIFGIEGLTASKSDTIKKKDCNILQDMIYEILNLSSLHEK